MSDSSITGTCKLMAWGVLAGLIVNLPFISWVNSYGWSWAEGFPLGWIGAGVAMIVTFFHEIGHTVTAWFYGYVALPSFDFQHGGGMAYTITGQLLPLNLIIDGAILYGIYTFRENRPLCAALVITGLFHLATAYQTLHMSLIDFMGPGAEALFGGFFLIRAWFDLAARSPGERFCNALFGFGLIFHAWIDGWALIHDEAVRQVYFEQKGQYGFGDFDKISDALIVNFNSVVWTWMSLTGLCLIAPGVLYFTAQRREFH